MDATTSALGTPHPNAGNNVAGTTDIPEAVETAVEQRPWVQSLTRVGWLAKGAVYILMGLTALTIGRQQPTADDASPEGALAQVIDKPAGRLLLGVLAVGLILYSSWRLLTAVLTRGNGVHEWLERIGYTFSAAFYALLAVTAVRAVLNGNQPGQSNTVEDLSRSMLQSSVGRWVLLLVGLIALGVGVYFFVEKGLQRSFLKDLTFDDGPAAERKAVTWSGTIGWMGRGFVTSAVGWFVLQAAWQVDQNDARGFDRALREVATHQLGTVLVSIAGVALVIYGVYCILSLRHRKLT
jgi:succinate dehydrogenase hydrophobic anchor subunit